MGAQRDQCTRLSSLRPIPEVPSAPLLPTNLSHACPSSLEPCTCDGSSHSPVHPLTRQLTLHVPEHGLRAQPPAAASSHQGTRSQ